MSRYDKETNMVTQAAIREFAVLFRKMAAHYDQLAETMKDDEIGFVYSKNFKSAVTGMEHLGKFAAGVVEAYCAHHAAMAVSQIAGGLAELRKQINLLPDNAYLALEEATKLAAQSHSGSPESLASEAHRVASEVSEQVSPEGEKPKKKRKPS